VRPCPVVQLISKVFLALRNIDAWYGALSSNSEDNDETSALALGDSVRGAYAFFRFFPEPPGDKLPYPRIGRQFRWFRQNYCEWIRDPRREDSVVKAPVESRQSHDSARLSDLSLESRLFLVVVRLFQNTPIPINERLAIFHKAFSSLCGVPTELVGASCVLERLLENHKDLVHVTNITARFCSRHIGWIEGGPTPIIFESVQLRDPALTQGIDDRISMDDGFRSLAEICVSTVLDSESILNRTRPDVIGLLNYDKFRTNVGPNLRLVVEHPFQYKLNKSIEVSDPLFAPYTPSRGQEVGEALDNIDDNFLFNSAVEAIERCPSLLNDTITLGLVKLLKGSGCEHIFFTCCKSFRPIFTGLPEQLQEAILGVSHHGAKNKPVSGLSSAPRTMPVISMANAHEELTKTILRHKNGFGRLRFKADFAMQKIIWEGQEQSAEVIVASIRPILEGGRSRDLFCGFTVGEVLLILAKSSSHLTRGIVADLWSKQKGNPYPELEDVYKLIASDKEGYVQTAFREGIEAARCEWI